MKNLLISQYFCSEIENLENKYMYIILLLILSDQFSKSGSLSLLSSLMILLFYVEEDEEPKIGCMYLDSKFINLSENLLEGTLLEALVSPITDFIFIGFISASNLFYSFLSSPLNPGISMLLISSLDSKFRMRDN